MYENVVSFERPASLRETLQLIERAKGRARVMAGGKADVVQYDSSVRVLIDISNAGLRYVRSSADGLAIGAATTLGELAESTVVRAVAGGILARAVEQSGSVQNRNLHTLGGRIARGTATDLLTTLLALDAHVVLAEGRRRPKMPLAKYLAITAKAKARTLLIEVVVPKTPRGARSAWSYLRLGITSLDASIVSAAAGLQLDARGHVKWVRLAVCSTRLADTEELMTGRLLDAALLDEAASRVALPVIADQRATAEYRREMSRLLCVRALRDCAMKAGLAV